MVPAPPDVPLSFCVLSGCCLFVELPSSGLTSVSTPSVKPPPASGDPFAWPLDDAAPLAEVSAVCCCDDGDVLPPAAEVSAVCCCEDNDVPPLESVSDNCVFAAALPFAAPPL